MPRSASIYVDRPSNPGAGWVMVCVKEESTLHSTAAFGRRKGVENFGAMNREKWSDCAYRDLQLTPASRRGLSPRFQHCMTTEHQLTRNASAHVSANFAHIERRFAIAAHQ